MVYGACKFITFYKSKILLAKLDSIIIYFEHIYKLFSINIRENPVLIIFSK